MAEPYIPACALLGCSAGCGQPIMYTTWPRAGRTRREQLSLSYGPGSGRSSCRLPVLRHDRGADLRGRHELQVGGRAVRGEQPLAGAEDRGEGQQPVLVDEVVAHQYVHEAQTAHDDHIPLLALDCVDDVAVHGC